MPAAQHGDLVGDLADLAHLVGDQHDADALGAQRADHAEQPVHLDRGQHARRLVEDQDLRAGEQHLDQLDPLPFPDRQVGDAGLRVDGEAVAGRGFA